MKLVHKLAAKELGKKIRDQYYYNPMSGLTTPSRDSDSGKLLEYAIKRHLIKHTGMRGNDNWLFKEYEDVFPTDDEDYEREMDDELQEHEEKIRNVNFKKHFPYTYDDYDLVSHEEEPEDVIKELHNHVTSEVFKKK